MHQTSAVSVNDNFVTAGAIFFLDLMFPSFSMEEFGLFRRVLHGRKAVELFLVFWFFSYSLQLFSELSGIQLAVKTCQFLAKRDWASHAVLGDVKPLGTEVSLPILLLMPMLYLGGINDVQYIQGAVCAAVLLSYVERFLKKSSKKGYCTRGAVFFELFGNHPVSIEEVI